MSNIRPDVKTEQHPSYRTINVNGVFGGLRGMYVDAILYSEELNAKEALSSADISPLKTSINRTLECRLVIDPLQAKSLAEWLMSKVNEYEIRFGRIPSELGDKSDKSDSHDSGVYSRYS